MNFPIVYNKTDKLDCEKDWKTEKNMVIITMASKNTMPAPKILLLLFTILSIKNNL